MSERNHFRIDCPQCCASYHVYSVPETREQILAETYGGLCSTCFRERLRREAKDNALALASLERAVLAACVEERRAFELRQALPSQIEAVTRYDDAIRARRAAVTQYVAALDAKSSSSEQQG